MKAIGIQILKAILGLSLSIKASNKIPKYATLNVNNIILRFFIFRENERKERERKNSAEN